MAEVAKLELDGKVYEFPVIEGSENEKAIDISKLRGTTGYITIDPGFKNTGSTKSGITFLNGEEGGFLSFMKEVISEFEAIVEEHLKRGELH